MPRLLDHEIPRVWVRVSLLALTGTFCLLMGISIAWIRHLSRDLPSPAVIQEIAPSLKTLVLSARGDTIHEFYRENRAVVTLPRIPLRLQQAVVAIEDRRFYDHYGVDARRIVKIIWVNLTSRSRPGASTLTQQLARNLFLTPEKTVSRKLKEIILALQIEQTYTKDEILAMYLNQIYLGRGA
jgi:penicillin-binding protein 1A